jgi:PhzF family phenazine biosynthesis protein
MNIPLFQVDAFTGDLFGGNPAAVCLIDTMLPDALMQHIAAENNLSETAFVIREEERFRIRWFTPVSEVDLCGHATLAASHVLFHHQPGNGEKIEYASRSGILTAARSGSGITLDFPADTIEKVELPSGLSDAIGKAPFESYKGKTDYLLVYESESDIVGMEPDFQKLKQLPCRGMIITAPGVDADFVSRFFAPLEGINEDPVTGSAHTTLAPYWAARLGKRDFLARQLSARRGVLSVGLRGDRVEITGHAVMYMTGSIVIPDSMT